MDIRTTIVANRQKRVKQEGHALGVELPVTRTAPIVPFPAPPGIICEVKRKSPSKGAIDTGIDPFEHIRRYAAGGAGSVSILTEEDYFSGSLADLIEAKRRFPQLSILRKDFLFDEEDLDVSYRAGADAVLLIASVLDCDRLAGLQDKALELGLTPLVEVHDSSDLEKISGFQPGCVGFNARNLQTFQVDLLDPVALRSSVDWDCTTVFESGIWSSEDAALANGAGFDAMLVGESVVRNPEIVPRLISGFTNPASVGVFWSRLVGRRRSDRPLVKVCGLTQRSDVELAADLGADLLGFIFADSPRRVTADFVRSLPKTDALKVAVFVGGKPGGEGGSKRVDAEPAGLVDLIHDGHLDAIQFHGDQTPVECSKTGVPYYKALRIGSVDDVTEVGEYRSPRVLVDSRVEGSRGGTGTRIDEGLVDAVSERGPLWLAGGLGPENIRSVVDRFGPELVDVSSGLESAPGIKDPERMKRFFSELQR